MPENHQKTIESILANPSRVLCSPFPNNEFTFPANISPRACLFNQAAGRLQACRRCATGLQVKAAHPEIEVVAVPLKWGNPWIDYSTRKNL